MGGIDFQGPVSAIANNKTLHAAFGDSQKHINIEADRLRQEWKDQKKARAEAQGVAYWKGDHDDVDNPFAYLSTTKLYVAPEHLDHLRISIVAQLIILGMITRLTDLGEVAITPGATIRHSWDSCLRILDQLALKPAECASSVREHASPQVDSEKSNPQPVPPPSSSIFGRFRRLLAPR